MGRRSGSSYTMYAEALFAMEADCGQMQGWAGEGKLLLLFDGSVTCVVSLAGYEAKRFKWRKKHNIGLSLCKFGSVCRAKLRQLTGELSLYIYIYVLANLACFNFWTREKSLLANLAWFQLLGPEPSCCGLWCWASWVSCVLFYKLCSLMRIMQVLSACCDRPVRGCVCVLLSDCDTGKIS